MTIINATCPECGGEGRLYKSRYGGNDPDVYDVGKCEACDGAGRVPMDELAVEAAFVRGSMMRHDAIETLAATFGPDEAQRMVDEMTDWAEQENGQFGAGA